MKIHLDRILVTNLTVAGAVPILVRILVGDAEMLTESAYLSNGTIAFPDIYEFNLDDVAFATGLLELEIEVMNVSNPQDPVLLGESTKVLRQLFPRFDATTTLSMNLTLNHFMKGEIRLQGIITEHETILDELKLKFYELDGLKKSFDGGMTPGSESDVKRAMLQAEKANKKLQVLQQKYNELHDKSNLINAENERLLKLLESENNRKGDDDLVRQLKAKNEELQLRLTDLTGDLEKKKALLDEFEQYKFQTDLRVNKITTQAQAEVLQVRRELENLKQSMAQDGAANKALMNELNTLKVSKSIVYQSKYYNQTNITVINNTYIQNVINCIISNKGEATEALNSQDIEKLKVQYARQSMMFYEMQEKQSRMLARIHQLSHNFVIGARTRPPSDSEATQGNLIIENVGGCDVNLYNSKSSKWQTYELDHHWAYDSTQSDLLNDLNHLVAHVALEAIDIPISHRKMTKSASLVCHGGKGTGKSFSCFGVDENPGLVYRFMRLLFQELEHKRSKFMSCKESGKADIPHDAVYDYNVMVNIFEVVDDRVFNLSNENMRNRADYGSKMVYDRETDQVTMPNLSTRRINSFEEGVTYIASLLATLYSDQDYKGRKDKSNLIVEIGIEYHFSQNGGDVRKSKISIVDMAASDPQRKDTNVAGLESVMTAFATKAENIPFDSCKLTKYLQPFFGNNAMIAFLVHLAPTDLSTEITTADLHFATKVKSIISAPVVQVQYSKEYKEMDKQVRHVTSELKETRMRFEMTEEGLIQSKSLSEEIIKKLNDGNKLLISRYNEEKDFAKQLKHDLALTQRNLKKAISETQEQRRINERLVKIVKSYEDERNSLNALLGDN